MNGLVGSLKFIWSSERIVECQSGNANCCFAVSAETRIRRGAVGDLRCPRKARPGKSELFRRTGGNSSLAIHVDPSSRFLSQEADVESYCMFMVT